MAKWNLKEYIKRNLINGYKDGTWTESKVSQLCISYMEKGYLDMEDVEEIDEEIQKIKAEREAEANAEATEEVVEDFVEPTEAATEEG